MQHANVEDTKFDQPNNTWLDRRVDLTAIPASAIAWVAVALAAIMIRLIGRDNWPLSAGEAAIAHEAWALLQGDEVLSSADAHPVLVQLTALSFFLFGDTDYTARLIPLAAGIGILAVLYWLRAWFGNLAALSIAIVWAISPVMAVSTLRLDGGAVLMLSSLLVFTVTMTLAVEPGRVKAVILGIALAVGLTAHPLGWIVLPLTLIPSLFLMRDVRFGGQWATVGTTFVATFLIVTSWFATRLTAMPSFFSESLTALWENHIVQLGSAWQASLVVLLVDEPLLLVLSLIGLAAIVSRVDWDITVHPAIFMSCLAWAGPMVAAGILLAGKGPDLYAVMVLPLVVLGGLGLAILLEAVFNNGWQRGFPLLWGAAGFGLLVASVRFAELLARGPDGDAFSWVVNLVALAMLILLPLAWVTIRMTAGRGWTLLPVALLLVVVLLTGATMRTSLLLHDTSQDRPGEALLAGSSTVSVGMIERRLRTYSRDATMFIQDARDTTGGHGLMVAVHNELADPFTWYFRDFPNLVIVQDPEDIPADAPPDVLIAPATLEGDWGHLAQHRARTYDFQFASAQDFKGTTYRGFLLAAINPFEFGNVLEFVVYRSSPDLLETEQMIVSLRQDHADAIWGPAR